jgi:hypothetical protein
VETPRQVLPASAGVTQVSFAPDGLLLLAGERKSSALVGWDIRHTRAPIFTCRRHLPTNQHLQFDVDASSSYCATADCRGRVLVYDIRQAASAPDAAPPTAAELQLYHPEKATAAADINTATAPATCSPMEVVNSVNFHPFLPVMATGSGSRGASSFCVALDSVRRRVC